MYCMPIVGTSANLYFPSERSNDPLVIGCVRKNGSSKVGMNALDGTIMRAVGLDGKLRG